MINMRYITVSTEAYLKEEGEKNMADILRLLAGGYEIVSAVGTGGSVHYILTKNDNTLKDMLSAKQEPEESASESL